MHPPISLPPLGPGIEVPGVGQSHVIHPAWIVLAELLALGFMLLLATHMRSYDPFNRALAWNPVARRKHAVAKQVEGTTRKSRPKPTPKSDRELPARSHLVKRLWRWWDMMWHLTVVQLVFLGAPFLLVLTLAGQDLLETAAGHDLVVLALLVGNLAWTLWRCWEQPSHPFIGLYVWGLVPAALWAAGLWWVGLLLRYTLATVGMVAAALAGWVDQRFGPEAAEVGTKRS